MPVLWLLLTSCILIVRPAICCGSCDNLLLGGNYEVIDLTIPYDNKTVLIKAEENNSEILNDESAKERPSVVTLGGTYFESPSAYEDKAAYITEIPAQKMFVHLIVIDVSSKVNDDPKYVLQMSDVHATMDHEVLKFMSKWPNLLFIKFGWSKFYNEDKYLGRDKESGTCFFPVIGNDVAEWITTNEKIVGLGVDLPNIERNASEVHKTLAKAGIYVTENLNLTSSLPGPYFERRID